MSLIKSRQNQNGPLTTICVDCEYGADNNKKALGICLDCEYGAKNRKHLWEFVWAVSTV